MWIARSAPGAGTPYSWLRVRPRYVPPSFASLDVFLSELLPPPRPASASPRLSKAAEAADAKAPRLVALFSAAAHTPAAMALPTRRAALACPACGGAHALRGPADAEALLRHRYGAAWRASGAELRPPEASPSPLPPVLKLHVCTLRSIAARLLRAIGVRV